MAQTIREVMTENPTVLDADAPVAQAARVMRDADQGDVLISRNGAICGIVTDRDIVVRGVAETVDLTTMRIGDIASRELVTVSPDDKVKDAVKLMRQGAVRRLPVVEDGKAVGIVSIGDLAIERDSDSALADISAAPGNS